MYSISPFLDWNVCCSMQQGQVQGIDRLTLFTTAAAPDFGFILGHFHLKCPGFLQMSHVLPSRCSLGFLLSLLKSCVCLSTLWTSN